MSRRILPITLAVLMVAAAACQDEPLNPAGPRPAAIRITPDSLSVRLGTTAALTATVVDEAGRPMAGARPRFTSSRPDVAPVDSVTGVVTAASVGTAEITVAAYALETRLPVVVVPPGGDAVAVFYLESGAPWVHDENGNALKLETWSLVPTGIGFRIANAAYESLCGVVPLTLQVDSAVLSARPVGGCGIELRPRAEGTTWLTVRAGEREYTVRVIVHRTRFRWTFGTTVGDHVAGTPVLYEFAVLDENAAPVPGVPVVFRWSRGQPWASGTESARTGEDGYARVSLALPMNPATLTTYSLGSATIESRAFQVRMTAVLPDGSAVEDSSTLSVLPDAPDHIELLALRNTLDWTSTRYCRYCSWDGWGTPSVRYQALPDDPVVLRKQTAESRTELRIETHNFVDTLAAIVADRYGNPTAVIPQVAAGIPGLQTVTRAYVESSRSVSCPAGSAVCQTWSESTHHRTTGAVVVTNLAAPLAAVTLTLSAPGVPSRTVTVAGVESIQ